MMHTGYTTKLLKLGVKQLKWISFTNMSDYVPDVLVGLCDN